MQSSSYVERITKKQRWDDYDKSFNKNTNKKNKKQKVTHKRDHLDRRTDER